MAGQAGNEILVSTRGCTATRSLQGQAVAKAGGTHTKAKVALEEGSFPAECTSRSQMLGRPQLSVSLSVNL